MKLWRRRAWSTPTAQGPVVRVGLVGCVKNKGTAIAPAKDLYVSPLFRGRRRYVEQSCDEWFILSAKHHLVRPEQPLAPYDESLKDKSRAEIRSWSRQVLDALDALGLEYRRTFFEIHAGAEYRSFGLLDGLLERGARVEVPATGLSQGQQLAFYATGGQTATPVQKVADEHTVGTPAVNAASGSYGALTEFLSRSTASRVELTFRELEAVIGRSLPASATKYRAWWANERSGSHSHARSWLSAGWEVDAVSFTSAMVIFRRTG